MLKKMFLTLIVIQLFLFSCSQDMFREIATNDIEPIISKPTTDSFEKEDTIIIKWDKDKGADEYILYRSVNPNGGYSEIYRGEDLIYYDNVGSYDIGKFFYYKLAKKRESIEFSKSGYVYGVRADMRDDEFENNNLEDKSAVFTNKVSIQANICYYLDSYGHEIIDTDWYKLSIPPGFYAYIQINFERNGDSNDLKVCSSYMDTGEEDLYDDAYFNICNRFNERNDFSFKIQVNKSNILDIPNTAGTKTIVYTLRLEKIDEID